MTRGGGQAAWSAVSHTYDHRRSHGQIQHLPCHPIAFDSQQPVRMVARRGGIRLDQLEFDRRTRSQDQSPRIRASSPSRSAEDPVSVRPALSAYGSRPAREHHPMSSRNVSAPTAAAYSARLSIACRS